MYVKGWYDFIQQTNKIMQQPSNPIFFPKRSMVIKNKIRRKRSKK